MSDLYNRIEALCAGRGINITEMCRSAGASRGSLTDLKKGRTNSLNAATLSKISAYFEISVDALLGSVSEQKKEPVHLDRLKDTGYELLTPENQRMIDDLIAKLLRSQSDA